MATGRPRRRTYRTTRTERPSGPGPWVEYFTVTKNSQLWPGVTRVGHGWTLYSGGGHVLATGWGFNRRSDARKSFTRALAAGTRAMAQGRL